MSPGCKFFSASRFALLIALALLCLSALQVMADADEPIDVDVRIQGEEVFVDANLHVRATPQEAWAVMTDYDHATTFISKLEKSVVLSRADGLLLVEQKGKIGYGPFSMTIETVSEVRLTPYEEMRSRMISGNMKKSEATTRLVADGTGIQIVFHMESIPNAWIPPLIGRIMIEFEARARFRQLRDEILRRKASAGPAH